MSQETDWTDCCVRVCHQQNTTCLRQGRVRFVWLVLSYITAGVQFVVDGGHQTAAEPAVFTLKFIFLDGAINRASHLPPIGGIFHDGNSHYECANPSGPSTYTQVEFLLVRESFVLGIG